MSARPLRLPVALPRPVRAERDRVVAGVCGGLADALDVDATLVRLSFTMLAFAGGAGIVGYLGAWALMPSAAGPLPRRRRRLVGAILLVWSVILALRGVGLSDSLVWPLALVAAGAVLATGGLTLGLGPRWGRIAAIVLVAAGIAIFVGGNTRGTATTLLSPGAIAAALLLVLGPWGWQLVRERDAERAERIRTQERADLAARVHDSVLQTLALIQRDPEPRRVSTLARRQERELRAWLYPDRTPTAEGTLAQAIEAAVAEVEELHGVRVEVVRTGDAPLDDRVQALVLAAREAMTNAARHSGADEVSVFVDAEPRRVAVYVRDRGAGFDPDLVTPDRRGISESMRGRLARVGGTATIVSAPGEGTEVELVLPVTAP